jgi:hypothetical protein
VIGASQRCEKERRNVAGEIERKKSVEREIIVSAEEEEKLLRHNNAIK